MDVFGVVHALSAAERTGIVQLEGIIRSALFVPGHMEARIDKAVDSAADVVIIDLEDAVPLAQKESARANAKAKLAEYPDRQIIVRVNALGTGLVPDDLGELIGSGLSCVVLPKVESASDINAISNLLLDAEAKAGVRQGTVSVVPLIESAKGVFFVYPIVSERIDPRKVLTAAFGGADYALDMGVDLTSDASELAYARSVIPVACRAAEIGPPLDTPFMVDIRDLAGLRTDAQRARQMGFQGKMCIHPDQVAVCNAVFSPTQSEVDSARRIIEAFDQAKARGEGALSVDGRFVDRPVVERCRRIVHSSISIKQN